MDEQTVKFGFSDFARTRHKKGTGHSWFDCSEEYVLKLVKDNWHKAVESGFGDVDFDHVRVVELNHGIHCPAVFRCAKVRLEDVGFVWAKVERRQDNEKPYVKTYCHGEPLHSHFIKIVLYSKDELLKNGGSRSGDYDWEIVCIIATNDYHEPMTPLSMARNFLGEDGGTPRKYTAQEFAESIWYWSQYVTLKDKK